ncbi:MAG: hypothetical protein FWG31_03355 [Oscillospiraceae bacterium]|nr:hypothetical protein [Oscillospiraceae bacterium]
MFKRAAVLLISITMLLGFFPADASAASVREAAPDISIRDNKVFLGGSRIYIEQFLFRFECLMVKANDYSSNLLARLDVEDIALVPSTVKHILPGTGEVTNGVPGPGDLLEGSTVYSMKYDRETVKLSFGDVLLIRTSERFTANERASEWKVIILEASMFAPSSAESDKDLPSLKVTESSMTVTLKPTNSVFTKYEYSLVPTSPPAGYAQKWMPLGSGQEWIGGTKTVNFMPSGSPYTVIVRIAGDNKQGFLSVSVSGVPITAPKVLYTQEKIGPLTGGSTGSVWYFTKNDDAKSKKWETITLKPGEEFFIDIAKVLGKKEVNYQLKKHDPAAVPADEKDKSLDEHPMVLQGTLKPRPTLTKGIAVSAFVSEQYPANWVLTGAEGALETSLDGINWIELNPAVGLPLLTTGQQAMKVKAASYFIRLAPVEEDGIPASTSKKYTQPKQVKEPKIKPDYKKETIKLKAGLRYCFAGPDADPAKLQYSQAAGDQVSIEDAITNNQTVYVYTPESGKKSRSAVQRITLAERGETPGEGEGLVLGKNSASLQKGYEYFGSKEKWGSFTKGDIKGWIRLKATAKYNTKTGQNTGFAASNKVSCEITYSENGKNVVSIEMEEKDAIPLQSWGVSSTVTGGTFSTPSGGTGKAVITANSPDASVSFTISPTLAPADAALAASVSVSFKDQILSPAGSYSFKDLKVGDEIVLTITPKDLNTYGRTKATLTVVPPPETSPEKVQTGVNGYAGNITVTLKKNVPFGQSRKLRVDYIRQSDGKIIHTETVTVNGMVDELFNDTNKTVTLDWKKEIAAAGAGKYQVRAVMEGTGKTSDSLPAAINLEFTPEDFGIRWISTNIPSNTNPRAGSAVTVTSLRDLFTNELTATAYQWYYRTTQNGTRQVIAGANSASFTPTSSYHYYYLEVRIYANDIDYFYQFPLPVYPS